MAGESAIDVAPNAPPAAGQGLKRFATWELAAGVIGVVAAAAAVVVTLRADFLVYPGWLAAQKADLILGPIGVGLYWRSRRPASPFGVVLIAVGLLQIPYVLESASNPTLFTIGYYWESVVFLCTLALILTFPTGRMHLVPEGLIFGFALLVPQAISTLSTGLSSQAVPGGTISACRVACPRNVLVFKNDLNLAVELVPYARWSTIILASATAALLLWRLARGSPPRRRAFVVGTPIALIFLVAQVLNQVARLHGTTGAFVDDARWLIVVARSLIWYGFLFALIAAELFAGRVLRTAIAESLRRPSVRELEGLLRRPLGDPQLRLAFWRPRGEEWVDAEGVVVDPPAPGSGMLLTEVERDGRRAAAIVHDAQLADDPELLQAAGATALLALENAQLQSAWTESLRELSDSRARIATAAEEERHHLERDLHDGAQQRLLAVRLRLRHAADEAVADDALRAELHELDEELASALDELREVAHGIYPSALSEGGLSAALQEVLLRSGHAVRFEAGGVGRYATEVEGAAYYCCSEALQNAFKHAGVTAAISVRLGDDGRDLHFEVRDNGVGFAGHDDDGSGIRNMNDRVAALNGTLDVASRPGAGTTVTGSLPLTRTGATNAQAVMRRHWPASG